MEASLSRWVAALAEASQPFPARVTGVELVPKLDVFFILFPTQEHFVTADDRRKVNQAALEVFDLDFALLELEEDILHVGQGANPVIDEFATGVVAGAHDAGEPFLGALDAVPQFVQPLQPLPDLRQQRAGFVTAVVFPKSVRHGMFAGGCCASSTRAQSLLGDSSFFWT